MTEEHEVEAGDLNAGWKLTEDLRAAADTLSEQEARYLVDTYYAMQDNRKRCRNQIHALDEHGEPSELVGWLAEHSQKLEAAVKGALDIYSKSQPLGIWARGVLGIGPVIAAGLLAHIDITKAETAGAIWSFAGLDPTKEWGKGQKRPWNARLKTLCWKIGESFVKVSGKEDAFYGHIYRARKVKEWERNLSGALADQARQCITKKNIGKETVAYKFYSGQLSPKIIDRFVSSGETIPENLRPTEEGDEINMLPPAHIQARAKRYAVKLFLAHYFETGRGILNLPIPLPYPIAHGGHAHRIPAPA